MSPVVPVVVLTVAVVAIGTFLLIRDARDESSGSVDQTDAALLAELDSRVRRVELGVARMSDRQAIAENNREYARGLDRHDESLTSGVFWPDAALIYGAGMSVERLPSWANEVHSNAAAHQHHLTTLGLEVEGDRAHAEGDLIFSSNVPRDKALDIDGQPTPGRVLPGAPATLGSGRYIHLYERRGGDWRVLVHEYIQDVSVLLEPVDLCATGCLGRWDTSDISYLRPLRPLSVDERARRAEVGSAPRARLSPQPSAGIE